MALRFIASIYTWNALLRRVGVVKCKIPCLSKLEIPFTLLEFSTNFLQEQFGY